MFSDLMQTIYERLDREALLPELNPTGRGNVLTLECPQCRKREAYLYRDGARIQCNRRNKCGYSISLWDYVAARDSLDPQGTLRALAAAAHVDLPEREGGKGDKPYARELSRQALLTRAIAVMRLRITVYRYPRKLPFEGSYMNVSCALKKASITCCMSSSFSPASNRYFSPSIHTNGR